MPTTTQTPLPSLSLQALPVLYRRMVDARARRTASTAIVHSGGQRTVHGCVCGSTHTEATRYRYQSAHYRAWAAEHSNCMLGAVREAVEGQSAGGLAALVESAE